MVERSPITPRVLMLVRDEDDRERLQTAAQPHGLRFVFVADTTEVLGEVTAHEPDAIVLPLDNTEEESVLLCRALRRRMGEQTPYLLLVAAGGKLIESEEEALDAGAHAFLPVMHSGRLMALLRDVLAPQVARTVSGDISTGFAAPEAANGSHDALGAQLAALDHRAAPLVQGAALESQIRDRLDAARSADYFTLLGVARDADDDTVRDAYLDAVSTFEPSRFAGTPHAPAVALICEVLADAWHVLGDRRLRRHYQAALDGPGTPNEDPDHGG